MESWSPQAAAALISLWNITMCVTFYWVLKQLLVSPSVWSENYADRGGCYSPSRVCSYVLAHVFVGGFTMKVPPWWAWRFKEWQQRVRLKDSSKSVPDISTVISINVACEQANLCKFEEKFWRRSRHHMRRMCRGKVIFRGWLDFPQTRTSERAHRLQLTLHLVPRVLSYSSLHRDE